STGQVIAVCVMMGSIGLLDSMVITPRIVGGSVGLKPIEVLLTMMAAATLFGFLGVLLAVPLGAVLKILVGHAVDAYMNSGFDRQPPARHAGQGAEGGEGPELAAAVPSPAPISVPPPSTSSTPPPRDSTSENPVAAESIAR